MRKRWRLFSKY